MTSLDEYLPTTINTGSWATSYTLHRLRDAVDAEFVLPICSLSTPYSSCVDSGDLVLPPLYHEALEPDLKQAIVSQILSCFPAFATEARTTNEQRVQVVEFPSRDLPPVPRNRILTFSIDTAVEEHGPHLPLATDTIQSYSVLRELAVEFPELIMVRPVEYGQLTWGLPFGFSIDLTAELLTRYVRNHVDAVARWYQPSAIYVVDVHGSITHRNAIVEGLKASRFQNWSFRWLHEPLAPFASQRGDQHAGGVETALVERASPHLLDSDWWPHRKEDIARGQLSFEKAVELTSDLTSFQSHVAKHDLNGIVGDINNYDAVDANELFGRMLDVARDDLERLRQGKSTHSAGEALW